MQDVVIVGGGLGGVITLTHLVDKSQGHIRKIFIIEKDTKVGPGLAYSTQYDQCIVNLSYPWMGLYPNDRGQISRWIKKETWKEKYPNFDPENDFFPPRSLYTLYLQDIMNETLDKAKEKNISVEIITGKKVLNIKKDTSYQVFLDDGSVLPSDKIVLALGNFPPTTYQHLLGTKGYFPSFWPDDKTINSLDKEDSLLIIGTRLTAIDAVLSILDQGHKGPVTMASRTGFLPYVRSLHHNPIFEEEIVSQLGEKVTLQEVVEVVRKLVLRENPEDIKLFDLNLLLNPPSLKEQIQDSLDGKGCSWQSIIVSLSFASEEVWNRLEEKERTLFLEEFVTLWFVYRHLLPLSNAQKVLQYIEEGRLQVLGGLEDIQYQEDSFQAKFSWGERNFSKVINATDLGLDIEKIPDPLVKNLISSGLISPNPYGGIDVDRNTCRVKGSTSLYAIGYLTRGVHFFTNDAFRTSLYSSRAAEDICS